MKRMSLRPIVLALGLVVELAGSVAAQQASQNIPVLPMIPQYTEDENGLDIEDPLWYLKGDGYLQRQVEPTIAVSTRNPDHLLSFFVDYRAVDVVVEDVGLGEETQTWTAAMAATSLMLEGLISLPQIPHLEVPPIAAAEAWVGGSRSYDGGLTWSGFFMPGAPLEFYDDSGVAPSNATQQMPIYGLQAATDPVAVAGPCGYVYVVFMAFTRGDESKMVVARFQDLNNLEGGDTWEFQGMTVVESGNNATNGYFLDKPAIALDIFRNPSDFSTYASNFSDYECGHSVYISYSTFNGLESDGKFRSKINFSRSDDAGETWTKSKIQQPYNQNQGSALAVDPNNGDVYLVWRHFFNPDTVLVVKTEDRGKKFSKPFDLTEGSQMYPYDQPTISTTLVHPDPYFDEDPFSDLTFRSNAFPTAVVAVGPNDQSTLFVAWQEYVGSDGYPNPQGSPRIVLTKSTNGGMTWTGPGNSTSRRAVDFGDRDIPCQPEDPDYDPDTLCLPEPGFGALPDDRPSGPQVMPWLSAGGGKLALAYHESRGLLGGVSTFDPGLYDFHDVGIQYADLTGWGFISGLDRVVDFRVALLNPLTGVAEGSSQVSRYPISADADFTINGEDVEDVAVIVPALCGPGYPIEYCQPRLDFKNKPQSASGTAPFQGDYPGMSPISPFVFVGNKWMWATSEADVTYPGFHVVFADNRNLVPATTGAQYEEFRYSTYDPVDCANIGSRNTDVMTAQINADIMVSAPTTYKSLENPVNSFPFTIRNTANLERTFNVSLGGDTQNASFSYDIYAEGAVDSGTVTIYPFSSVSQVVYISASATKPVYVNIQEDGGLNQSASLTFNAGFSNHDDYSGLEVDNPFVRNPFVRNPFVRNPFVRNSSKTNLSLSNPFVRNPFVRNSSLEDAEVEEVIDTTWTAEPDAGATTAATYYPVININNAAQFIENYAFQLIVWKQSGFGGVSGCDVGGIPQDQILSNVVPAEGEDPFVLNPAVSNPFVRNESPENPFVRNPFVRNPFVRNSAFTMAPADLESNTGETQAAAKFLTNANDDDVTLPAAAAPQAVNITLRAHRLKKYCDEEGAIPTDCLQKPLCVGDETPATHLCEEGIVECPPGVESSPGLCVVPNVFNPRKDPPSASVGSERCFMRIVADPFGEYPGLSYEKRIEKAEEECFKSMAADLIPLVSSTPEGSVTAGGTLQFPDGWQVFNQGDGPATAENRPLRSGFYLSTDDVLDFDDATGKLDQLKGDRFLTGVEVGGTGTTIDGGGFIEYLDDDGVNDGFTQILIPPWNELPKDDDGNTITSYHLILYVDDLLEVSEKNEINNFYSAVFDLEISVPNTAPDASDIEFPTEEDTPISEGSLVPAASDADGDTLIFELVNGPSGGTLDFDPSGIFTYQPNQNFNGTDSFTFKAYDGEEYSDIATATITVAAVNDAPQVDPPIIEIDEDGDSVTGNVNASDPDGDALTYELIDLPNLGTASLENNGDFTYTPAPDQNGGDSFTVGVSDGNGGSVEATVNVTITAVNDPPVADDIDEVTLEDIAVAITLTATDVENDPLTYSILGSPSNGALSPISGQSVTYTPGENFAGTDSFTFVANDGQLDSAPGTVTIIVTAVNDAPVANAASVVTVEDTAISFNLTGSDTEGADLSYHIVDSPVHGNVSGEPGPGFTYTPVENYNGPDIFTFRVFDGDRYSSAVPVDITVNPVNDAPVAADGSASTLEDIPVSDVLVASDVDGDPLTYSIVTNGNLGTATVTGSHFTYTPSPNLFGPDSFTFRVSDGYLNDTGTVAVTIVPVNDPPIAVNDAVAVQQNSVEIVIDVLFNDLDVEDKLVLSVTAVEQAANGTTAVGEGGTHVTYFPNQNFKGIDVFTYAVSDGVATVWAAVTVTVDDGMPDYSFDGLLKPWKKNPLYTAAIGSAIPLKWYYTDPDTGDPVDSVDARAEIRIKGPYVCDEGVAIDTLETIEYPGASGFQYDTKTYLNQFNWDTNELGVGCYDVRVFSQQTWQLNGPFTIKLVD